MSCVGRIDCLKAKLGELEAAELETNLDLKKLEVALSLCAEHASLGMQRGVVKYAEVAITSDGSCVEAHLAKAKALQGMIDVNQPQYKAVVRALKACEAGLGACDKVVALENLSQRRADFREIEAQLKALQQTLPKPPPSTKKKKPTSSSTTATARSAPPRKLDSSASSSSSSVEQTPPRATPRPPPTTAEVAALCMEDSGGTKIAKSIWNTKDTWEERDVSNWAAERLGELLEEVSVAFDDAPMEVASASNLVGHAQIVLFQGRTRFLFEFESLDLSWRHRRHTGTMTLRDVANGADGIELEFAASDETSSNTKAFLNAQRKTSTSPLREALAQAVKSFERDFCALTDEGAKLARSFERSNRRVPLSTHTPP